MKLRSNTHGCELISLGGKDAGHVHSGCILGRIFQAYVISGTF